MQENMDISYIKRDPSVDLYKFSKNKNKILIKVRDLKKIYRIGSEKVRALNGIDLDIEMGEIVIILGTSGSGKSTFLNMLAGLEKPSKGSIEILGENISKMSENKLAKFRQINLGFIFQSYNLMPNLTAMENVALPLTFRRASNSKRNKEALSLLKMVGLGTHAKHKPTQMSGGQQQRVGIARAFAGTPKLIFADEPTGNLDSKTTKSVLKLMLQQCKEKNITLVLVTHDPTIAQFADKIVHIIDGVIDRIELNDKKELQKRIAMLDEGEKADEDVQKIPISKEDSDSLNKPHTSDSQKRTEEKETKGE